MGLRHLSSRFFGSFSARNLNTDEQQWVDSHLIEGEQELWRRMSVPDQRHAYGVARKTVELLGDRATRAVVAASLMHDIGKVEAQIGTINRVVATLAGSVATAEQKRSWADETGWLGRAGTYLNHNEIGAEMLKAVGSDPLTVAWAREHELVHTEWTLPTEITDALYAADNQ